MSSLRTENVQREKRRIKNSFDMFPEQYSKSDFLFDTLKWNNKIDFEKTGEGKERERKKNGSKRQI